MGSRISALRWRMAFTRYHWVTPQRLWVLSIALRWRFGATHTPCVRVWSAGPFLVALVDLTRP